MPGIIGFGVYLRDSSKPIIAHVELKSVNINSSFKLIKSHMDLLACHALLLVLYCFATASDTHYECDLYVDSSICLGNNEKVILPSARRPGRILYLTFDEAEPVDSSGLGNHAVGRISGHSGFGGFGTCAYFRKNFIYLKSNDSLKTNEFSYLFFVYLLMDEAARKNSLEVDQFCPVIHKGYKNESVNEAAPEISINPRNGQIRVVVSVEGNNTTELTSNFRLQTHQWYHLALVKSRDAIMLYVNGILDFRHTSKAMTRLNPFPLYIGSTPFSQGCDFPVLLDQLSVFQHDVGIDEIQAEASAAMGGVESSYISIGCINCRCDLKFPI
ncbi:Concanavalin A-like lectin-glucanase domain superfamily [Babesia duncani]|uniref:Concanavalin A-like lectin-glucanase domain superfamily n=1 Tax=Babesia duncani TaxID=323732 RepID=A0AAD9UQD6_9APIC|nr:Concanavalin A-like lectin-glucanase domain superfamily [Babesia duncani]